MPTLHPAQATAAFLAVLQLPICNRTRKPQKYLLCKILVFFETVLQLFLVILPVIHKFTNSREAQNV